MSPVDQESTLRPSLRTRAAVPCEVCDIASGSLIFVKKGYRLVRCSQCGLVYVENRPSEAELSKFYNDDSYHAELVEDSTSASEWHKRTAAKQFQFLRRFKKGGRILDVGCSVGFFLRIAKENGWEPHGVEQSTRSAHYANYKWKLNVVNSTLENANLPAGFFDAITLWDVIEHLPSPVATLRRIAELLKDDGVLIFATPNIDGLFPRLSYRVAGLMNYWPHPTPPGHLFQFSKKSIRSVLNKAGFDPVAIEDDRIAIGYSFGMESLKRAAYSALFVPVAVAGPLFKAGDKMTVAAIKRGTSGQIQQA